MCHLISFINCSSCSLFLFLLFCLILDRKPQNGHSQFLSHRKAWLWPQIQRYLLRSKRCDTFCLCSRNSLAPHWRRAAASEEGSLLATHLEALLAVPGSGRSPRPTPTRTSVNKQDGSNTNVSGGAATSGRVWMTHATSYQAPVSSEDLRSRLYSREDDDENHRLRKVIKHVQ